MPQTLLLAALLGASCYLWAAGMFAAAAPTTALLAYLCAASRRLQGEAMAQLRRMVDAVRDGDLTGAERIEQGGELAHIATGVESMTRRLSRVVAGVRTQAQLVGMASDSLSVSAGRLAERTEQQAAGLEETAAGVSELAATVRRNADAASDADLRAAEVRAAAESVLEVVAGAVASMQAMDRRASEMSHMVAAIDRIAFQTNLLALNAAVEAARAGEAGRGFAVVAAEVRSLAGDSAQSAGEVRRLIEGSSAEVRQGLARIRDASSSLQSVVQGVREIAEQMRSMSTSSAQQRDSLREISQAVNELDQLTQRNAQMVDACADAANSLSGQAQQLSAGVLSMRLRQGCADEARAMVERAAALIAREGRPAAVARFHDRAGGFIDRDMFIVVQDRAGIWHAVGADPSLAGRPAVAAPGVDVKKLAEMIWQRADAGGGWIEFQGIHPITRNKVDKMAYALPSGDDWVVICSVNKSDGEADERPARP